MRARWFWLVILAVFSSSALCDAVGDELDNRLVGSADFDVFYGGEGADTFVVDQLSERPDWILDFQPEQGDLIEIAAANLGLNAVNPSQFKLNSRGVLTLKVGAADIPLVDIRSGEFKFKIDSRKGRYFLKFDRKL